MDKCPCGNPATGSVNDKPFCNDKTCIDKVMTAAITPVIKNIRDAKK